MARFVTVTPNPAIDVTYRVGRQEIGETVRVTEVRRTPGGKGLNVARVLATLGREVTTVQPLGGAAGRWMAQVLAAASLPAVSVPVAGETRSTVTIVDDLAHPTLFAEPGVPLDAAEWARLGAAVEEAARGADWVVVAGSFPPGSGPEHVRLLVQSAADAGARVAVDTSGPLLSAAADAGADLVKANAREVAEATGASDPARALARHGTTVMVSRGADGAGIRLPDGTTIDQPALSGVSGNPTGAGDAATAGLVAALADGHDAGTALAWAAVCGAAAVRSPVAGVVDPGTVAELGRRLLPADHPLIPRPVNGARREH